MPVEIFSVEQLLDGLQRRAPVIYGQCVGKRFTLSLIMQLQHLLKLEKEYAEVKKHLDEYQAKGLEKIHTAVDCLEDKPLTVMEIIEILRQHNQTGASVQRLTKGKCLEHDLLAIVLRKCECLLEENSDLRLMLKNSQDKLTEYIMKEGENDATENY